MNAGLWPLQKFIHVAGPAQFLQHLLLVVGTGHDLVRELLQKMLRLFAAFVLANGCLGP